MNYVSEEMFLDIEDYLLERLEPEQPHMLFQTCFEPGMSLDEISKTKLETFTDKLFSMIKEKNLDEV